VQYQETHAGVATDQFGGYIVEVGSGTVVSGNLAGITATADTRIQIETRSGGGAWVLSSLVSLSTVVQNALNNITAFAWGLNGNSGTTAGTHFIGTTDDEDLHIDVRNGGTVEQSLRMNTNQVIWRESAITGIPSGNARGQGAVDLQISRDTATQVASGWGSTISGGSCNKSGNWATIAGGYQNYANGIVSFIGGGGYNETGDYSTIAGGWKNYATGDVNFIGGGAWNSILGRYSVIVGGDSNTINNTREWSFIAGGWHNTINSSYSVIGGGHHNTTTGECSVVLGGKNTLASNYGEVSYSSGSFAANGDAQTSFFVVRNTTTNGTATGLYLDGNARQMTLNDQDFWTFRVLVVGGSDDHTNYGSYIVTGFIHRNGATTTIAGVTTTTVAETSAGYDATAVVSGNALVIRVTGDGTNTMRWVARVEVSQLNY
jgi:hypothetical protein